MWVIEMNIIEYVNTTSKKIDTNRHLDALILAQSIYFEFEKIPFFNEKLPLKIADLEKEKASEAFRLGEKSVFKKNHVHFINALIQNPVFQNVQIVDFQNQLVEEIDKQFAAITYLVNGNKLFIAFRGTDSTMIGWKEDFNMMYSEYVPSQLSAKAYLEQMASQYPYEVTVSGHSKGGNIAVYAATTCKEEYVNRIKKVYNFDGPGFPIEFANSERYNNILKITEKYVPQFSFFGTLMNSSEPIFVIKSSSVSLYQHDPYSWLIKEGELIRVNEISPISRQLSNSISTWLKTVSKEQRERATDELFQGFKRLNICTIDDLRNFLSIQSIKDISIVYNSVDPEIRSYVIEISKELLRLFLFDREKEENKSFYRKLSFIRRLG